jgi:hypothetical protein
MRHPSIFALSLCGLLLGGCSGGSSGDAGRGRVTVAVNTLLDQDGDGTPDAVWVADWDGDGALETHDVQQAIDALEAAGPAPRMTIVVAEAGTYAAPTTAPWYQADGLIALPSHSHLRCEPGVVLSGMAPSAYTGSGDENSAVVTNADGATTGNVDITVEGCTIHGGKDAPYSRLPGGPSQKFDAAIAMMGADDVEILDNVVSWTNHACIYTRNLTHATIRGNRMEYCGGYLRNAPARFPGLYNYVTDSPNAAPSPWAGRNVSSHLRIESNTCFRVSGTCFNTRHDDVGSMAFIDWADNTSIECGSIASLKGVVSGSFTGHRGDGDIGGITIGSGVTSSSSFQSEQPDPSTMRDFLVDDVEIRDLTGLHSAITVGAFGENVTVRNVRVLGTSPDMDCLSFLHPNRDLLLEEIELRDCGRHGLVADDVATPAMEAAFAPDLRSVTIACVDARNRSDDVWRDGFLVRGPLDGMRIEDLSISGVSRHGVNVGDGVGLVDQEWTDTTIDMTPCGYLGDLLEAAAAALTCDPTTLGDWLQTTDADFDGECDFTDGGGAAISACRCGVAWSGLAAVGSGSATLATNAVFAPDELVRSATTLVLRPGEPDEERCRIDSHDTDTIACDADWTLPPSPGDAWQVLRWDALTGVSPFPAAISFGSAPSRDTTSTRLTVRDPSGIALDLDGPAHQNLTFDALKGERNTLGSFGASAILLDHGNLSAGTSAAGVVCEALAPGRSFSPCVAGSP